MDCVHADMPIPLPVDQEAENSGSQAIHQISGTTQIHAWFDQPEWLDLNESSRQNQQAYTALTPRGRSNNQLNTPERYTLSLFLHSYSGLSPFPRSLQQPVKTSFGTIRELAQNHDRRTAFFPDQVPIDPARQTSLNETRFVATVEPNC